MSQSLNIIQSIIDENLIDAKTATQAYLNDILSEALKEKFEEVAPTVIGEEKKKVKSTHVQPTQNTPNGVKELALVRVMPIQMKMVLSLGMMLSLNMV